MFKIKEVTAFVKEKGQEIEILRDINLTVEANEIVSIIGATGSGKSSIFNMIMGELAIKKGSILVNDQDLSSLPSFRRAPFVSYVGQDPRQGTLDKFTIFENMNFAYKRGKKRQLNLVNYSQRKKIFKAKLEELEIDLEKKMDEFVFNLSGGQRQALAVIMNLLEPSPILLLDEITASLDPINSKNIINLVIKLLNRNPHKNTTLMITHNMEEAIEFSSRILVMENCEIKQDLKDKSALTLEDLHQLIKL